MILWAVQGFAQTPESAPLKADDSSAPVVLESGASGVPAPAAVPLFRPQPKRILGVMPNYRAVSAGTIPPPPGPRQALKIATQNSFDYSAFIFGATTSLIAEAGNKHPQLGTGLSGFGNYYWRGFADRTNGNYLVVFALPTLLHIDERYYAKGQGGVWKRGIYAASRTLITPNYQGHNTFNAPEVVGRGLAQVLSTTYYPQADRNAGALAAKFGWAMGRDALTNVFRELWPDISAGLFHHRS